MRKIHIVLAAAAVIALADYQPSHSDCLACWELKGIVVELKSGKILEGYTTWNDAWLAGKTKTSFPEVVLEAEGGVKSITFYSDIRTITYPDSGLKISVGQPRTVPVESISSIELRPGVHDGYEGAGNIPVVSERTAQSLLTEPVATCRGEGALSIVYWISYNQRFGKEELRCLCNPKLINHIRWSDDFERNKFIRLEFAYD